MNIPSERLKEINNEKRLEEIKKADKMEYSSKEIKIAEEIEENLRAAIRFGDLREGNMENCLNNIFKKYKNYEK